MTNSKVTTLGILALAAITAFLVVKYFFPQIIEQFAAGIVALGALLIGLIFRRNKTQG